jgi:hypothetical protein
MDQLRFERDVLKDETRRLQALARSEPPQYSQIFKGGGGEDTAGIPDLHSLREGRRQQTDDRIKFPRGQGGVSAGRRDGSDFVDR